MKKDSGVSVLIFGAGGRQTLPLCRGFYQLGCRVTTYCRRRHDTGRFTRYKHACVCWERAENPEKLGFRTFGLEMIKRGGYDLVVPTSDAVARFLSNHKHEIDPSVFVAVNDWEVQQYASDKALTMQVCAENGVPAPKTLFGEHLEERIGEIDFAFPVVVKPRTGMGSIGFQILRSRESLEKYLGAYDPAGGPLLIQEYIPQEGQPQYRADFYRTADGAFKAACVGRVSRWYPLDGGSGIFIESVHDEAILEAGKRLLDAVGWVGYANLDLLWDPRSGEAKIIEINGRPGASIKIDFLCGVDISRLMLEDALGGPVTDLTAYPDGRRLSCFLPDLLWFLKSPDRFRTKPSWFDRRGIRDMVFQWSDPLPSIGFLLESLKSFRRNMSLRTRFEQPQNKQGKETDA